MKIKDLATLTLEGVKKRKTRIVINIIALSILLTVFIFAMSFPYINNTEYERNFINYAKNSGVIINVSSEIDDIKEVEQKIADYDKNYVSPNVYELGKYEIKMKVGIHNVKEDIDICLPNKIFPKIIEGNPYTEEGENSLWITEWLMEQALEYNIPLGIGDDIAVSDKTFKIEGVTNYNKCLVNTATAVTFESRFSTSFVYTDNNSESFDEFSNKYERIFEDFNQVNAKIVRINDFIENTNSTNKNILNALAYIVAILVAVSACFVISNSIILSINENHKYTAILHCFGIKKIHIMTMLMIEIFAIVVISLVLSLLYVMIFKDTYLNFLNYFLTASIGMWGYFELEFAIPTMAMFISLIGYSFFIMVLITVKMKFSNNIITEEIANE